eukprot:gnl/Chilomastix_cuspidata/4363.p1 GENE.gnl/Chilomastix_cuspidata/4363~~gnl/Chilomastix_cuspidata/4363.p1  ORF type:complete len:2325 (+),score=423.37 gnl/Chilomastix_cuspidata/4363:812-7786(+)
MRRGVINSIPSIFHGVFFKTFEEIFFSTMQDLSNYEVIHVHEIPVLQEIEPIRERANFLRSNNRLLESAKTILSGLKTILSCHLPRNYIRAFSTNSVALILRYALIYLQSSRYDSSMKLVRMAQAVIENPKHKTKHKRMLKAVSFALSGSIYRRRKKYRAALQAFEQAHRLEQSTGEADEAYSTHLNISYLLSHFGRHQEALQHATEGLSLVLASRAELEERFGVPEASLVAASVDEAASRAWHAYYRSVVIALHNLACEERHATNFDKAQELFASAHRLALDSFGRDHQLTAKMLESLNEALEEVERRERIRQRRRNTVRTKQAAGAPSAQLPLSPRGASVRLPRLGGHSQIDGTRGRLAFDDTLSASSRRAEGAAGREGSTSGAESVLECPVSDSPPTTPPPHRNFVRAFVRPPNITFSQSFSVDSEEYVSFHHAPEEAPLATWEQRALTLNRTRPVRFAPPKRNPSNAQQLLRLPHAHVPSALKSPSMVATQLALEARDTVFLVLQVTRIQTHARAYLARKRFSKMRYDQLLQATTRIQGLARSYVGLADFRATWRFAALIQRSGRGALARGLLAREARAATHIQRVVRGALFRKSVPTYVEETERAKSLLWTLRHFRDRNMKIKAVRTMQRVFRGERARRTLLERRGAAQRIESALLPRFLDRRRYEKLGAEKTILRAVLARTEARRLRVRQEAVVLIQAVARLHLTHTSLLRRRHAASAAIAAFLRSRRDRRRYICVRGDVAKIQMAFRARRERRSAEAQRFGAERIQQFAQRVFEKASLRRRAAASVTISRWCFRALHLRRIKQRLFRKAYSAAFIKAAASRRALWAQRASAATIQSCVRMRLAAASFQTVKSSSRKLQSFTRKIVALQSFGRKQRCVLSLQRRFRGREARAGWAQFRQPVRRIQVFARIQLARRRRRRVLSAASVILCAVSRRHSPLRRLKNNARTIQRFARSQMVRKRFLHAQRATCELQAFWRSCLRSRRDALQTQKVKTIQRFARAALRRSADGGRHQAAMRVESFFLAISESRERAARACAAARIQRLFRTRAGCAAREERLRHQKVISDSLRASLARRAAQARAHAALQIQAQARSRRGRRDHAVTRRSAQLLQRFFRKCLCERTQACRRLAALRVQRALRSSHARKELELRRENSRVLVGTTERHTRRRAALCRGEAAAHIFSWWRAAKVARRFRRTVRSAGTLQTWWRRVLSQKQQQSRTRSSVRIQRAWRGARARRALEARKLSMELASRALSVAGPADTPEGPAHALRAFFSAILIRDRRHRFLLAVQRIQAVSRGAAARRALSGRYHSAVRLQLAMRRTLERRRAAQRSVRLFFLKSSISLFVCRVRFLRARSAAATLQRWWRSQGAAHTKSLTGHVVVIQAFSRRVLCAKQLRRQATAARVISAAARRCLCALRRARADSSRRTVAALCASSQARARALERRRAALKVTSVAHGNHARAQVKAILRARASIGGAMAALRAQKAYRKITSNALLLQAFYRRHAAQRSFVELRGAASHLQLLCRRRRAAALAQEAADAATQLQRFSRASAARNKYVRLQQSSDRISVALLRHRRRVPLAKIPRPHTALKAAVWMLVVRRSYQRTRVLAVRVQAAAGGRAARRLRAAHEAAAVSIQRTARRVLALKATRRTRCASLVVYRLVTRRYQARETGAAQQAASVLCAAFQAEAKRARMQRVLSAALALQRAFRAMRSAEQHTRVRSGTRTLQRLARGRVGRTRARHMKERIVLAQSICRMFLARRRFFRTRRAALVIRAALVRSRARRLDARSEAAAMTIQRSVRALFSRRAARQTPVFRAAESTIATFFIKTALRREYANTVHAASALQAFARHLFARRRVSALRGSASLVNALAAKARVRAVAQKRADAVLTIQNAYRRSQVWCGIISQERSARSISNFLRAAMQRRRFLRVCRTTRIVQRVARGHLGRARARRLRGSSERIRSTARTWAARKRMRQTGAAGTAISSFMRGAAFRRSALRRLVVHREASRLAERCIYRAIGVEVSRVRAAVIIQRAARSGARLGVPLLSALAPSAGRLGDILGSPAAPPRRVSASPSKHLREPSQSGGEDTPPVRSAFPRFTPSPPVSASRYSVRRMRSSSRASAFGDARAPIMPPPLNALMVQIMSSMSSPDDTPLDGESTARVAPRGPSALEGRLLPSLGEDEEELSSSIELSPIGEPVRADFGAPAHSVTPLPLSPEHFEANLSSPRKHSEPSRIVAVESPRGFSLSVRRFGGHHAADSLSLLSQKSTRRSTRAWPDPQAPVKNPTALTVPYHQVTFTISSADESPTEITTHPKAPMA